MATDTAKRGKRWTAWIIAALVLLNAGWMVFDGSRALIAGDYMTPSSGPHAGQLGPWSKVVEAVGVEPRSKLMKSVFVLYGTVFFAVMVALLLNARWARAVMIGVAILGLWHLPFGTLINLIIIALLSLQPGGNRGLQRT